MTLVAGARGQVYQNFQKIVPSDSHFGQVFGNAVSVEGQWAMIGAQGDAGVGDGNSGSVYVYRNTGNTWTKTQELFEFDNPEGENFGTLVEVDADVMVVANRPDPQGYSEAFILRNNNGTWVPEQKLTDPRFPLNGFGDFYAASIAVSGDVVIVGEPRRDLFDPFIELAGAAYIYRYDGSQWNLEQTLFGPMMLDFDFFGLAVAVQGDTAVITGLGNGEFSRIMATRAYIYHYDGQQWTLQQELQPPDNNDCGWGKHVVINDDLIAVSADCVDLGDGAVFLYRFDGTQWNFEQTLHPDNPLFADESFGSSIAVDGNRVLVGNGVFRDAASFFQFDGTQWTLRQQLTSFNNNQDTFGSSVALDGRWAFVGAAFENGVADASGAMYVFDHTKPTPGLLRR